MNGRLARNTVVIGTNGTGKTTLLDSIINKLDRRTLIVVNTDEVETWHKYPFLDIANSEECNSFTGVRRITVHPGYKEKTFKLLDKNILDAVIIFDDCKKYIKQDVDKQPHLTSLRVSYRHKGLDLFFVVHSVNDLPPRMWGNMSHAIIGASQALISGERKKNLDSSEEFVSIQKSINGQYKTAFAKKDNSHFGIFKAMKL